MIIDQLGMLRADGSSPAITATEAGSTSLVRDATTGKVVIGVYKTPQKGLPVVVMSKLAGITNRSFVVTIEASNTLFANPEVVATFPAVNADGQAFMVRRVHTQKKYLRSVITVTDGGTPAGNGDFLIVIGHALMET